MQSRSVDMGQDIQATKTLYSYLRIMYYVTKLFAYFFCFQTETATVKKEGYKVIYVTGFWKTDRIVTLGLFHFIGPANGYTHTLHIHTAIVRLG